MAGQGGTQLQPRLELLQEGSEQRGGAAPQWTLEERWMGTHTKLVLGQKSQTPSHTAPGQSQDKPF